MTVSVILEGTLKDGEIEKNLRLPFEEDLEGIDLTYNTENPKNWIFTEVWDSKQHYEKYLQFRTEDGTLDAVASLCEDAPSIRIFDIIPT